MKKIVYISTGSIYILDSKDYVKIEEDGQYLDDKYVDPWGRKFNEYRYPLDKDEIIIRKLYSISLDAYNEYYVCFKKYKNYELYNDKEANKINKIFNTKNSVFFNVKFNNIKRKIVYIFSDEMKIKIE